MTYKDIVKVLKRDGWQLVRTKGSHCQFKHPFKKGCVTVPQHGNKDITMTRTISTILKR